MQSSAKIGIRPVLTPTTSESDSVSMTRPPTAVALGTGGGSDKWAVPKSSETFTAALRSSTPVQGSDPKLTVWNPSPNPRQPGDVREEERADAGEKRRIECTANQFRLRWARQRKCGGGGKRAERDSVRAI